MTGVGAPGPSPEPRSAAFSSIGVRTLRGSGRRSWPSASATAAAGLPFLFRRFGACPLAWAAYILWAMACS